jgi:pilus assembly protein CpaC
MRNGRMVVALAMTLMLGVGVGPFALTAQAVADDIGVVNVAAGNSTVVTHPASLERVMITNPDVADAIPVTAREVVINGLSPGTTTLLFWDNTGARHAYSVRVTADIRSIQSEMDRMMPGSGISVSAVGNRVVLTGEVTDPRTSDRAMSLAAALAGSDNILNYISTPDPGQVMLQVRVAEVSRSAIQELGLNLMRLGDGMEGFVQPGGVGNFSGAAPGTPTHTFSDAVNFYLFHQASGVHTFIRALQDHGVFRSLAEPNLITMPGEPASFLAGGEFPYPMVQPQTGQVTVQFREFGILLNFTPTITNSGAIRLHVEPEVSSLDFANGVQVAGSLVPALTTRRAETVVELNDGQTFAIAGLMDREMTEAGTQVPILGDIPILGALFRSRMFRENETEVLVLVTPRFVRPGEVVPAIPPNEPETWPWSDFMTRPLRVVPPADAGGEGL